MVDYDPKFKSVTGMLLLLALPMRRNVPGSILHSGIAHYLPEFKEWMKEHKVPFKYSLLKEYSHSSATTKDRARYFQLVQDAMKFKMFARKVRIASKSDHTIHSDQIKLFNATISLLSTKKYLDLDKKERPLVALVAKFGPLNHKRLWRRPIVPQTDLLKDIQRAVKKLSGDSTLRMTTEQAVRAREENPVIYKEYLRLSRMAKARYSDAVHSIISSTNDSNLLVTSKSGVRSLPVTFVREELEKAGITIHPLMTSLNKFWIGEDGALYTKAGKKIGAFPTVGSRVELNPDYDANSDDKWVMKVTIPGGKGPQWVYTTEYRKSQDQQKYSLVRDQLSKIPKARKIWLRDFSGNGDTKTLGAMAELLYSYAMRIGGENNKADGKATYGLSTARVRHLKQYDSGAIGIVYPGKKGTGQKHVIRPNSEVNRSLIQFLVKLTNGKAPKDRLFTFSDGSPITSGDVNRYLKRLGLGITSHKMRHLKAYTLFQELEKTKPLPKNADQKKAEAYFKELVSRIGAALGHVKNSKGKTTWTTAAKSYLDPGLASEWFTSHHKRIPSFIQDLK